MLSSFRGETSIGCSYFVLAISCLCNYLCCGRIVCGAEYLCVFLSMHPTLAQLMRVAFDVRTNLYRGVRGDRGQSR